MLQHRPINELGGGNFGWLKARHHFAVGIASDNPAHTALGNLIVWNDDEIQPGTGFPEHGHRDIEIITYVRQGVVAHRDNLGNYGEIHAGDVQVISAGTGVRHAESGGDKKSTKLFQIWIRPREIGGTPRWGTKPFPKLDRAGPHLGTRFTFCERRYLQGAGRPVDPAWCLRRRQDSLWGNQLIRISVKPPETGPPFKL